MPHLNCELPSTPCQPEQTVDVRKGVPSSPTDMLQRSAGQPPGYHLSAPSINFPHVGERGLRSNLLGMNSGKRSEIPLESSPPTQGGVNTQPKTEMPTTNTLSLNCRMCEAPPTVTAQPTVTTCGHLFCSECVPTTPGSTTRRLTPHQVYNRARNIHVQVSCVQQFPLVVLFI